MVLNDVTTLNGLKQDLYFIGKFNSGTFQQNDLNRIINKYYQQAQMIIRGVSEDFYAVPTKADLNVGQYQQYSWPTDYEKIKLISCAMTPNSMSAPLRSEYQTANIVTADQITQPGFSFTSPTIIAYGDYFEVLNNVVATDGISTKVTNGIRMVYIPLLATLSNDTDTPNIFTDYQDVITWGSLIDIAPRLNNDELLVRATQMFEKRKKDLADYASNRIQNMAGEYVEGQTGEGGWDYGFGGAMY